MARHTRYSGNSSRLAVHDKEIIPDKEHAPFPNNIDSYICIRKWPESCHIYGMGRPIELGPR